MILLPQKKKAATRKKKPRPVTWNVQKGGCKAGGRAAKAKGRAAVQMVCELLLRRLPLRDKDVFVKATSQGGCDLHLSPLANDLFPFDPEVKNTEKLKIWEALTQAKNNTEKGKKPCLFFKRANTPLFIAMLAEDYFDEMQRKK